MGISQTYSVSLLSHFAPYQPTAVTRESGPSFLQVGPETDDGPVWSLSLPQHSSTISTPHPPIPTPPHIYFSPPAVTMWRRRAAWRALTMAEESLRPPPARGRSADALLLLLPPTATATATTSFLASSAREGRALSSSAVIRPPTLTDSEVLELAKADAWPPLAETMDLLCLAHESWQWPWVTVLGGAALSARIAAYPLQRLIRNHHRNVTAAEREALTMVRGSGGVDDGGPATSSSSSSSSSLSSSSSSTTEERRQEEDPVVRYRALVAEAKRRRGVSHVRVVVAGALNAYLSIAPFAATMTLASYQLPSMISDPYAWGRRCRHPPRPAESGGGVDVAVEEGAGNFVLDVDVFQGYWWQNLDLTVADTSLVFPFLTLVALMGAVEAIIRSAGVGTTVGPMTRGQVHLMLRVTTVLSGWILTTLPVGGLEVIAVSAVGQAAASAMLPPVVAMERSMTIASTTGRAGAGARSEVDGGGPDGNDDDDDDDHHGRTTDRHRRPGQDAPAVEAPPPGRSSVEDQVAAALVHARPGSMKKRRHLR